MQSNRISTALGEPYDQSIDYRREIAGRLHTKRCYLCLEAFTENEDKGFRSEIGACGMRWCADYLMQWTIKTEDIWKVSGLQCLLKRVKADAGIKSVWLSRFADPGQVSWKPYVDAILRKTIGIDFDTAVAKEEYMRQVSKALTATKQPITALRQASQRGIVQVAQDLSTSPSYDNGPANLAKLTSARSPNFLTFLFRAGLLIRNKCSSHTTLNEAWLSDPTADLKVTREVRRKVGDAAWN